MKFQPKRVTADSASAKSLREKSYIPVKIVKSTIIEHAVKLYGCLAWGVAAFAISVSLMNHVPRHDTRGWLVLDRAVAIAFFSSLSSCFAGFAACIVCHFLKISLPPRVSSLAAFMMVVSAIIFML